MIIIKKKLKNGITEMNQQNSILIMETFLGTNGKILRLFSVSYSVIWGKAHIWFGMVNYARIMYSSVWKVSWVSSLRTNSLEDVEASSMFEITCVDPLCQVSDISSFLFKREMMRFSVRLRAFPAFTIYIHFCWISRNKWDVTMFAFEFVNIYYQK